jgi:NAD(P)-dependent dehydrogenase (short-subunit alcohol dehydrogenase family)
MTQATTKTALVTGANAGLGFEAAAQLAEAGWSRVILACRSVAKAEEARSRLKERTGKDPFATLAIDTSEVESAKAAAAELAQRGERIDYLLLNAGASKKDATFTSAAYEITYASTLVGHHVLTLGAVEHDLLNEHARIVIAGSEGARGNMPGMGIHDIGQLADKHHSGDRTKTIASLFRLELPEQKRFENMNEYVTAKLIVAWWTAALAGKLPKGITVNCVSPGANLATSFGRDAPAAMKLFMMPMMKLLGGLMGMNGPIEDGAKRYLDAAERSDDDSGHFYATAHPKKLVGAVGLQETFPQFFDSEGHQAAFDAIVELTGVAYPKEKAEVRASA